MAVLDADRLTKAFTNAGRALTVLDAVSFAMECGVTRTSKIMPSRLST
ncbi:MAG: hypothetical protein AAGG50_05675 [Bacteroidota bacterium]